MRSNRMDEALYGRKYRFLNESTTPSKSCGCDCDHAQSHFDAKIGTVINGMAMITADTVVIKLNWEKAINDNSAIKVSFSSVELRSEMGIYFLFATDTKTNQKAIVELIEDRGGLYEKRRSGGGFTITCSGCSAVGECAPKMSTGGEWYCTQCFGVHAEACIKTITLSLRSILGGDVEVRRSAL